MGLLEEKVIRTAFKAPNREVERSNSKEAFCGNTVCQSH